MKKLLLGCGALVTIVSPISMMVACGTNSPSAPLYKMKTNLDMSDRALNSIVVSKGFKELDFNKDIDTIKTWLEKNQSTKAEDILSDLKAKGYDSKTTDVYYVLDSEMDHNSWVTLGPSTSGPSTSGYYQTSSNNYGTTNQKVNYKVYYLIVNKKTNKLVYIPSNMISGGTDITFSDFDAQLGALPMNWISKLESIRTLEKGNSSTSKDEDSIKEIINNILGIKTVDLDALSKEEEKDYLKTLSEKDVEDYNNAKKTLNSGEYISELTGNMSSSNKKFIKLKWLSDEFKFDSSIYEKNSSIFNDVEDFNDRIKYEFEDRKEFFKKVNDLFFKKFMSDDKLNALISKFNFKKWDIDNHQKELSKEDLEKTKKLEEKYSRENVTFFGGGTSSNLNYQDYHKADIYLSITNYKDVKSAIRVSVDTDGTNNIDIGGRELTSIADRDAGFKKAFDHGITAAPLDDISDLINLRRRNMNTKEYIALLNRVIESIAGIDVSFDPSTLKDPSDKEKNPQKEKYEDIKKSCAKDEYVVAIRKGSKEHEFLKVKRSIGTLKFDINIYKDTELDQLVIANKFNNILASEFGDKKGFYKKLEKIFY